MPLFEYRAVNASGAMVVATMEATTREEVLTHLERSGYTPISTAETTGARKRTWREALTPEPRGEDITAFTLDLAMLLAGGVVLDEALLILSQMVQRRWLSRLIRELHVELSGGKSFSQVLAMHPALFPPAYVKMVEVAEASGHLERALGEIAVERQRGEKLRKRFVSALAYPSFLLVAGVGVLCFVLLYVIPQFEVALQGFRDKLQPSTLMVFNLSAALRANLTAIVVGLMAVLGFFLVIGRIFKTLNLWTRLFAWLPVTRGIYTYDLTVTFCTTLAILIDTGVDMSTALRLVRGVMRLPRTAGAIDAVIGDVRQGSRLTDSLARRSFLPPHVVQMLRVGEESGRLAESARRVAGFYEAKLEGTISRAVAVLGPAMMIGVSVMVAWLIASVMTALISINDILV